MRVGIVLGILALLVGTAQDAQASEEGVLIWTAFSIQSAGIGESGPVQLSGAYGDGGLARLSIKAFGREVSLSKPQLEKLRGLSVNRMQLSYEEGYRELGGRTVYAVLGRGFLSGARDAKLITLNERGDITIREYPEGGRRTTR